MGIKIEDLTVTFKNQVTAINHASLEIPKGIFGLFNADAGAYDGVIANWRNGNVRRYALQRREL